MTCTQVQVGVPGSVEAGLLGVGHHGPGKGTVILRIVAGTQSHHGHSRQFGGGEAHLHIGDDEDGVIRSFLHSFHDFGLEDGHLDAAQSMIADQLNSKLHIIFGVEASGAQKHANFLLCGQVFDSQVFHCCLPPVCCSAAFRRGLFCFCGRHNKILRCVSALVCIR